MIKNYFNGQDKDKSGLLLACLKVVNLSFS